MYFKRIKNKFHRLLVAALLPVIIQTVPAAVLLSDSFQVSSNSQNVNQQLVSRQTGLLAPAAYTGWQLQHQVGNTTTDVGQPGGATNGNYVLLAFDGAFFSDVDLGAVASGPVTVEFDMYLHGANNPSTDPTSWVACSLRAPGNMFPVCGVGEFAFLVRANGGVQVFQNGDGAANNPAGFDTANFATNAHWTLTFSDSAGTGSAFNGNGSQVTMMNGTKTLGTIQLAQLNSAGLRLGWRDTGNRFGGISNFKISGTPSGITPGQNLSFEYDVVPFGTSLPFDPTSWTSFNAGGSGDYGSQDAGGVDYSVNNPLAAPADGNQYCYVNVFNGTPVGGIYQDMGALQPNTIYTLTVAIGSRKDRINSPGIISLLNGKDNTGTVLATGGGLPSTQDTWQDYTTSFATGGSVSGDLTIMLSALGAGTIQADFDNVRLTAVHSSVPLPIQISNIAPSSATVAIGSNVVFTAAFTNTPPVSFQWQFIGSNGTNNINTGVVDVTNNGVVTSTLTLHNVQLTNAGAYRLEAINATNLATVVYTAAAPLTVIPTITWYAGGTYNSGFSDNSVLALAGSSANEVYGVDFGGSGLITTANGYTFDDYASAGNVSVISSGLNTFGGYLGSASTGDGNFDIVLNNGVYGSSANTATLNNLTVGQSYTVLVLLDDTRSSGGTFQVTDGLTFSPVQQYAFANGLPAVGGYIIGTFTAQATTQPLTVVNNGNNSQYNAILLETGIAPAPPIPPTLTTDLTTPVLKVTTGGAVTLAVAAQGALPLSYQWYNQSGPISGATNTNYSFSAVAGTNYYQVIVTNSFGSVTSSVAEVISSPNIVTVNNFSFENGTGAGYTPASWTAFNYSWSGVFDDNGGNYPVYNPLDAPADGNNFFACNTGPGQPTSGIYQVCGALQSSTTYTLTVAIGYSQAAPVSGQSTWSPGTISLINGTNNNGLVLASTNGIPTTAGTWQDYSVTFITGPSVSGNLTVALSVVGAPTWQAQFDNVRLTKASAPAVVPPTLLTDIQLLRSEVTSGTPITLAVVANGNPLYYQWYKQGVAIGSATTNSYSFNAVIGTNAYQVVITNSAGSVTSSIATVISAPNIITVNNFSFENGLISGGPGGGTLPVSWLQGDGINWCSVASGSYSTIPDGTSFFALNEGPVDPTGGIYQDVGALLANTTYTLTVAIGRNPSFGSGSGLGSPGIISLLNGTDNTGTLLARTNGIPDTAGTWQDYNISFTTGASVSGDLTIFLSVAGASTYQANFDNVRLTKAAAGVFTTPIVGKVSGGKVILTGTGTPNAGYTVLTTTNLLTPLADWTVYSTGTSDGAGVISNAIPVNASQSGSYFWLRMP